MPQHYCGCLSSLTGKYEFSLGARRANPLPLGRSIFASLITITRRPRARPRRGNTLRGGGFLSLQTEESLPGSIEKSATAANRPSDLAANMEEF